MSKWIDGAKKSVRFLGPYLLSVGFATFIFGGSFAFAVQGDLFSLRQVSVEGIQPLAPSEAFRFAGLRRDMQVLNIDLKGVEDKIRSRYPEFRTVKVLRVLPHEILIRLEKRVPIAQIRSKDRYHLIDRGLMVLSSNREGYGEEFPVIRGLRGWRRFGKGVVIRNELLDQSVNLISEVRRQETLGTHRLTRVEMDDGRTLTLWIDDAIEVRMNSRDLIAGYKKFLDALENLDLDPESIRYIDLRFDDIVIGPR